MPHGRNGPEPRRNAQDHPPELVSELVESIVKTRYLALKLTHSAQSADDLVQQTFTKALAGLASFTPGTNMNGWLYAIMRNEFYDGFRKRRHEEEDPDEVHAKRLSTRPTQSSSVFFVQVKRAMKKLVPEQAEAIQLVCVSEFSYEAAAERCGVAEGTMKSRVHRGRLHLAQLLGFESAEDVLHTI